jgi:hypothetical protein
VAQIGHWTEAGRGIEGSDELDAASGELLRTIPTLGMPDGIIYKACGNRRTTVCPSCAEIYRRDAYHLIRVGLAGGQASLRRSPITRPSLQPSPHRLSDRSTSASSGSTHAVTGVDAGADRSRHARRQPELCPHGLPIACYTRRRRDDPHLGQPLCPDCYDYAAHAIWNNQAGGLWRRTKQAIERHLNQTARRRGLVYGIRVSHGKAAEYQARGAVHFHVLLRLDGLDPADPARLLPPPPGLSVSDLEDAIRRVGVMVSYVTPPHHASLAGWRIGWGTELDVRAIKLQSTGAVTDLAVASYLAKYSTKGTEASGHASARITPDTVDLYADPAGTHAERLVYACWTLGTEPAFRGLRRWAHMLGFGGHFLTKARYFSVRLRDLRDARISYQRGQDPGPEHRPVQDQDRSGSETVLIVGAFAYAGSGWRTTGDALLANTAADQARKRREAGRQQLADEFGRSAA